MDETHDNSSDSSDEEYVPSDCEALSEEEHSGEEDDLDLLKKDAEEHGVNLPKGKGTKRKANPSTFIRKRKGGIKLEGEDTESKEEEDTYNQELADQVKNEQIDRKVVEEKKKADDLWADFMKDVGGPKSKPKPASTSLASLSRPLQSKTITNTASTVGKVSTKKCDSKDKNDKVVITKQYDFAGETVTVTKEVDAHSKEAKKEFDKKEVLGSQQTSSSSMFKPGIKKPGGLGSVLGKIGTKPKMGTLEKSKLDWDSFKKDQGIEEELQIHNRGKEGYVERMNFLERADVRQFEIEKNLRLSNSKRGFFSGD